MAHPLGASNSRRGLLAAIWSVVGLLTIASFIIAFIFAYASRKYDDNAQNYDGDGAAVQEAAISLTSRAMVFTAIWTAVLSGILGVCGTVILGVQSPTGKYYACCSGNVHRMTPLGLGAFAGSLLMFANLTLICSVLFGEFEVRDFSLIGKNKAEDGDDDGAGSNAVDQSSLAFSIMCMFFTIMYAGFAALVFAFSNSLLEESVADAREELSSPSNHEMRPAPGFIGGDRFGVSRPFGKGTTSMDVL